MTAIEVGTGTSYPITIPSGGDPADIQAALKYISYGIGGTPTTNGDITSNSIFGKMSLLAPKAAPAFTGNGSITGNFSIGGNLTITGTIDVLSSTTALIKDKKVILGTGDVVIDADADGGGIQLNGTTPKTLLWIDGTDSWTSSEHINLSSTSKNYKIAGTTVLTNTAVLGIAGTNIPKKDSPNTFTGPNIFSTSSQNINGITFTPGGNITNAFINNEWSPITTYTPVEPIAYSYSGFSVIGSPIFANQYYDNNGDPYSTYYYTIKFTVSGTPGLLVNQSVYYPIANNGPYPNPYYPYALAKVVAVEAGYLTLQTLQENITVGAPYTTGNILDYTLGDYPNGSPIDEIQRWRVGGTSGTTIASVSSNGVISAQNGFRDIDKTYHSNASVPRISINVQSGNLFSLSTAPTTPTGWANTTASASTGATSAKWYATDPATVTSITAGNGMTYTSSSGAGGIVATNSGLYHISASATTSSAAVAGTMMGVYVISADGTRNLPIQFANIGAVNTTQHINFPLFLNAGEKVGIAIKTASAAAVTLKADGSFSLSAHLIG